MVGELSTVWMVAALVPRRLQYPCVGFEGTTGLSVVEDGGCGGALSQVLIGDKNNVEGDGACGSSLAKSLLRSWLVARWVRCSI